MSKISTILMKMNSFQPELTEALCVELQEQLTYQAFDATYINEENVFNLARELKGLLSKRDYFSEKQTQEILKIGSNDPGLIDLIFQPAANSSKQVKIKK